MTFLEFNNWAKTEFKTKNQLVIFQIIFKLSKKVKTKIDFLTFRNKQIDFDIKKAKKLLNDYFVNHKPLGQIIKTINFLNTKITINKNVFEPRAETEELINDTIKRLTRKHKTGWDLCTGTGCIAIAIKKTCPWIDMTCVDIDKNAINNTKLNAKNNKVKISIIKDDFFKVFTKLKTKFDFIICNPPYVELKDLKQQLIQHESRIAFNNKKPLDYYLYLLMNRNFFLKKNGFFAFELDNKIYPKIKKYIRRQDILQIVQSA